MHLLPLRTTSSVSAMITATTTEKGHYTRSKLHPVLLQEDLTLKATDEVKHGTGGYLYVLFRRY